MQQELAAAGSPEPGAAPARSGARQRSGRPRSCRAVPARAARRRRLSPRAGERPCSGQRRHAGDVDATSTPPENVIGAHLGKLHSRLKRDARRFGELAELERHAVRKRLKRLRYLAELVAPLYRGGRVERFLEQLGPAQDELGRYMDLIVASAWRTT